MRCGNLKMFSLQTSAMCNLFCTSATLWMAPARRFYWLQRRGNKNQTSHRYSLSKQLIDFFLITTFNLALLCPKTIVLTLQDKTNSNFWWLTAFLRETQKKRKTNLYASLVMKTWLSVTAYIFIFWIHKSNTWNLDIKTLGSQAANTAVINVFDLKKPDKIPQKI